jgi:hypothetical protein
MIKEAQKNQISQIKKALELRFGKRITWDELAEMAGIEPRTLKTYRMPESSADYRHMPQLAKQALERLLAQPKAASVDVATLVSALSSLVISQARIAFIDRAMISGLDATPNIKGGLSPEERRIMAMVSRFCLQSGLLDHGGEIHDLLSQCKQPLQDWLRIPALVDKGLGPIVLIDPEYGVPTPEAQDLAQGFSTMAARIEERLFDSLKESLKRYPAPSAAAYYTAIREFVVRNPVVSLEKLIDSRPSMPGALWLGVQQEFYERIPSGLGRDGKVHLCAHCSSLMQAHSLSGEMRCTSRACHRSRPAQLGQTLEAANARRVLRSIHQYWVEPGIDEIFLFDAMVKDGFAAQLYPYQDAVDIAVGDIGMDLKTYASPEILGAKFKNGIGGLAQYARKWVVIPDWLVSLTPNYLERLKGAMGEEARNRMQCLSTSQARSEVIRQRGSL